MDGWLNGWMDGWMDGWMGCISRERENKEDEPAKMMSLVWAFLDFLPEASGISHGDIWSVIVFKHLKLRSLWPEAIALRATRRV